MEAPGPLPEDPRKIPYRRVDTQKFPWLEDPWYGLQDELAQ
jgi:microcystin degradation protein MlrC